MAFYPVVAARLTKILHGIGGTQIMGHFFLLYNVGSFWDNDGFMEKIRSYCSSCGEVIQGLFWPMSECSETMALNGKRGQEVSTVEPHQFPLFWIGVSLKG